MAFQSGVDPSTTSDINKIIERTEQTENQIIKLQKQIEFLEAGDYKTFIMCKIVQIREKMQQLNNKQKLLTEINTNLKQEISSLTTSIHKLESDQKQQELNNENKQDNNNDDGMNDASHGYANKKLSGMCQCEMCREGIATTHNDESHDQSLFGTFTLDVDDKFTLNLVGGSTKCGRVMANYFGYLEINKKVNIFKDKKCLEVGSGTGIVGCTIAYLNANKVMMTDQPGVIEILSENAKQLNKYNKLFHHCQYASLPTIPSLPTITPEHSISYTEMNLHSSTNNSNYNILQPNTSMPNNNPQLHGANNSLHSIKISMISCMEYMDDNKDNNEENTITRYSNEMSESMEYESHRKQTFESYDMGTSNSFIIDPRNKSLKQIHGIHNTINNEPFVIGNVSTIKLHDISEKEESNKSESIVSSFSETSVGNVQLNNHLNDNDDDDDESCEENLVEKDINDDNIIDCDMSDVSSSSAKL
eukprot:527062_1